MEVSPTELMDILNKILAKRELLLLCLMCVKEKLQPVMFGAIFFCSLMSFFYFNFHCFRWRPEDRRFQHRVLSEHGCRHGCILSQNLMQKKTKSFPCHNHRTKSVITNWKWLKKILTSNVSMFAADWILIIQNVVCFLNVYCSGSWVWPLTWPHSEWQHRETGLPRVQIPVEQHQEMAGQFTISVKWDPNSFF